MSCRKELYFSKVNTLGRGKKRISTLFSYEVGKCRNSRALIQTLNYSIARQFENGIFNVSQTDRQT